MTTNNPKNQLQKFYAKRKLALPNYSTRNVETNVSRPPLWLSTVTAADLQVDSPTTATTRSATVTSDMAAASAMLRMLSQLPLLVSLITSAVVETVTTSTTSTSSNRSEVAGKAGIAFIDLENVQLVLG